MDFDSDIIMRDLDWHKTKPVSIRSRGNMALVSTSFIKNEEVIINTKKRYVWPVSFASGDTKVMTRRILGKDFK